MCGIFGVVGGSKKSRDASSLDHRGPDDSGTFTTSVAGTEVHLDHTRLSIIGLGSQGHQPFISEDGSIVLTYNGEIYNYKHLRERLSNRHGCVFETSTDTEVLLKSIQVRGLVDTIRNVVGMFAFGVLDRDEKKMHIVRDRLGIKPLYYSDKYKFTFSSEVKAILERTDLEAKIDHDLVGEYLANFWVYEPDTLFEDIYKLESANFITYNIENGNMKKREYWSILDEEKEYKNKELAGDIEKIVNEQLVSDVPVGVYLSGGIDSSIVAYHASRNQNLTALNLRNDSEEHGEYENLLRLKDLTGVEIESFRPDRSMLEVYKDMMYYMDEPIADPAIIPANLLAGGARERNTKVMLSGMGGDEIFGGYRRMWIISNAWWLKHLTPLIWLFFRCLPDHWSRLKRNVRRVANFLSDCSLPNYFSLSYYFSRQEISSLTNDEDWYDRYSRKIKSIVSGRNFVDDQQKYQYLDIRGYLASHNLIYMDKASMAESVEVRVPLLDSRFAKKYFNLPTRVKTKNRLKEPLKKHVSEVLGDSFVGHKKQGFSFPIEEYVGSDLGDEFLKMLEDEKLSKVVDIKKVKSIINNHINGKEDNIMKIWAIYTLWLWIKKFDVEV